MKEKWWYIGFGLGLTVNELGAIETMCHYSLQCIREVLKKWRISTSRGSWKPLTDVLDKLKFAEIADRIKYHLVRLTSSQEGIYYNLSKE